MTKSDDYIRDARGPTQSPRGSFDAAFEAGYMALLSVLAPSERAALEHPSDAVIRTACARLTIDASQSVLMARQRFAPSISMSLTQMLDWAESVRARVRELD